MIIFCSCGFRKCGLPVNAVNILELPLNQSKIMRTRDVRELWFYMNSKVMPNTGPDAKITKYTASVLSDYVIPPTKGLSDRT